MKNIFIAALLLIGSAAFAQIEQPVVKTTDSISGSSPGVTTLQSPLYVVDRVLSTPEEFRKIKSENIVSVSVLKNAEGTERYGKSDNGVIVIKTKDGLSKKELRKVEREQKKLSRQYKRGE